METATRDEGIKKIAGLIKKSPICMLTTADSAGRLHSRPMATNNEDDFDGTLWYFTPGHSLKTAEVSQTHKVNAAYSDPSSQNYISLSGTAEVITDKAEIKRRWKPSLTAWFPKGVDEPDIALLRVTVESAEYWDAPSSLVAHAISLVKAAVTGRPADPADHKRVEL